MSNELPLVAAPDPEVARKLGLDGRGKRRVALGRHDVLLVPNAALRFTPPRPAGAGGPGGPGGPSLLPGGPPRAAPTAAKVAPAAGAAAKSQKTVYTLEGGQPVAHAVTAGATDGDFTEIVGGSPACVIVVVMPLTTFQRRVAGSNDVDSVLVSVAPGRSTAGVIANLQGLWRERRRLAPGREDDFSVRDMKEIAQALSGVTNTLTSLLAGVAAVSLVVGGIGIMNVMLVSVTERTREIGIRLSIGARGREVLLQFLVEAVALSTLGGIVGIALGLGGSFAATRALRMPFVFVPSIVALAFAFSASVGIAFGYLPARKAARLNPIDALRHE